MPKITYANKVDINTLSQVLPRNKVSASDLNQIRDVVNNTVIKALGIDTNTWSSSSVYNEGDIVVSNFMLYKNKTGNNTTTAPSSDTTNWEITGITTHEDDYNTEIVSLNSGLYCWKYMGDTTGSTPIVMPTDYNELLIIVYAGGNKNLGVTFNIPKMTLGTSNSFNSGYYWSSSYNMYVRVTVTPNEASINTSRSNNADVLSTSTLELYYR